MLASAFSLSSSDTVLGVFTVLIGISSARLKAMVLNKEEIHPASRYFRSMVDDRHCDAMPWMGAYSTLSYLKAEIEMNY